MSTFTLGNNVILYMWVGSGDAPALPAPSASFPVTDFATNYKPLAAPQELSINRSGTEIAITNKLQGAYDDALMGRLTWTGSGTGVISFNATEDGELDSLVATFEARQKVRVFITELGDAATSLVPEAGSRAYVGDVLIRSLNESYSDQQLATYSIELRGVNQLVTVTTA